MKQDKKFIASYYDELSKTYDNIVKDAVSWTPPHECYKMLSSKLVSGNHILDLGIGTGLCSALFAEKRCEISGLDISSEMLNKAAQKFPNAELIQHDLNNPLPTLRTSLFDAVIAIGMLEFVENFDFAITEAVSAIKSKGYICFTFEKHLPDYPHQKDKIATLSDGVLETGEKTLVVFRRSSHEVSNLLQKLNTSIVASREFISYKRGKNKNPVYYEIILAQKTNE